MRKTGVANTLSEWFWVRVQWVQGVQWVQEVQWLQWVQEVQRVQGVQLMQEVFFSLSV